MYADSIHMIEYRASIQHIPDHKRNLGPNFDVFSPEVLNRRLLISGAVVMVMSKNQYVWDIDSTNFTGPNILRF